MHVHPLSAVPFVLLLAAIAVLPLVAGHWWHANRNKAVVAAGLALPAVGYLLTVDGGGHALLHELQAYASFIILLTALYTISGGVVLHGDLPPTAAVNTGLLATGAVLANLIGTTGASMLLIRPVLRINARRARRVHVPVFFIFVVSNTGGLLTPLGDPPLFLGFLQGVEFTWTLRLWPQWLLVNGLVLAVFFVWDRLADRFEKPDALGPRETGPDPTTPPNEPLRVEGWQLNGPLMLGVIAAVLAQKYVPFPVSELAMVGLTLVSLWKTPKPWREANGFGWGPMVEVAVLFAGIFVTMGPALALLQEHGGKAGVTRPWEFFWLTGLLSSALDNAPTYLTMATLAGGGLDVGGLAAARPDLLAAISCGAVFMGANTYIGNGPNFMVKAIAEEGGYAMPSFGGYALYALAVLLPVFAVVTVVFFRG
jgi:Na+/H+ antiporter NhaD/arsenite permease-like protein